MAETHDDFEATEQVGSETFPQQCSALRKNGFVVLKGFPCKIVDMSTSKTGKHGHAKASITAIDIFTGKKLEDQAPTTHNVEAPFVKTQTYSVMDIANDGGLSLLDDDNNQREDLSLPPDETLANQIKEAFDAGKDVTVVVTSAMGKEQILSMKSATA